MNDWIIILGMTLLGLVANILWHIQTALYKVREAMETQNEISKKMLSELESIHNRASATAQTLWDQSPEGRRAADESRSGWLKS